MGSNRLSFSLLFSVSLPLFIMPTLTGETSITISGNPEDSIALHAEQNWNTINIHADAISKKSENGFDQELKTLSFLAEPFTNTALYIGSLSSSGLYSRSRNPLPQYASSKPPTAQKPINTTFSHSQSAIPASGGFAIGFPHIKFGLSVDLQASDARIPDFTQNPDQIGLYLETPQSISIGPIQFKGGIFSSLISRNRKPATSWFSEKTDEYSPLIHFSLGDGWMRWKKLSGRFTVFRRSSPIHHAQHALRLEADYAIRSITFSSGIFYCQPDFTDAEDQSPAATFRICTGFNSEWRLSSIGSPLILWSGVISREKPKKESWHSMQPDKTSAGTRSIVKFKRVSVENEYIYSGETIEHTHQVRIKPRLSGSPTAHLKASFEHRNMNISGTLTLKPFNGLFIKTASSFGVIDQNLEDLTLLQTFRYVFMRESFFSSSEAVFTIPLKKTKPSFSFSATVSLKN